MTDWSDWGGEGRVVIWAPGEGCGRSCNPEVRHATYPDHYKSRLCPFATRVRHRGERAAERARAGPERPDYAP
ncbi:hypothetical protein GCM10014715_46440 [Streptomyces spiralis]|uniref:Uncharacterized protein n=1 Tax=Streptomyces spiralis TaxID=66376 RepID=A0A919DW99_9ACTN|nr:hypothetical protein GCM10014715_46440 [Streptomyces spiralis]